MDCGLPACAATINKVLPTLSVQNRSECHMNPLLTSLSCTIQKRIQHICTVTTLSAFHDTYNTRMEVNNKKRESSTGKMQITDCMLYKKKHLYTT